MIDSYEFGKIVVDGRTYTEDLIIYPDRVDPGWWREEGHSLSMKDLEGVTAYRPELLIIGRGAQERMQVPQRVVDRLQEQGIEVESRPTPEAVSLFNQKADEGKAVAALHLTC